MIDRDGIEPGHVYSGSVFPRSPHSMLVVVIGRDTTKSSSHLGTPWACIEVSRSPASRMSLWFSEPENWTRIA